MKKIFCSLFLVAAIAATAQNKMLSMEDAMLKARTTLAPENLKQLQFVYGTGDYVYLKKNAGNESWVKGNATIGEAPFLTLDQLNEKLRSTGYGDLKAMPAIQFNRTANWIFTANGNKISFDPIANKATTILPKELAGKENVEESSAGFIAYLDEHNLFVAGNGTAASKVTNDGSREIVYASSVHRDEFGISKGTFWSNSGKQLAFYRMDQSMVADYPIVDWSKTPAVNENIKYPMAGGKSHQVTVGVYNAVSKSLVYLKTGEPADQYLTNIAWSPDEKYVFIAVLNRQQDHLWLNQYDASTGDLVKTLFEETDDKYVEPLVPMLFLENDPAKFIWQSNRDGWNHLYLYDISGKLIRQITKGEWEVLEVKGFDEKGENIFVVTTQGSPVSKTLSQVNLKTNVLKQITKGNNVHTTQISSDGKYILDTYSNTTTPRIVELTNVKTGKATVLLQAANPLNEYSVGQLNIFTLKNKTGNDLYCRLYKPAGFDSTKKYPVIVYWYGGPHAQLILNSWNGGAGDYWFQYMAERGYVVFTLDTRGSDNRGKAFEQSIFRRAGDVQMEDMMTGIDYLGQQSYVDKERMGLFGWSYGGFMTTDFMLHHPGVFKAAVAGGPVMNWNWYEIMYGERYMDTPQENPEGYAATDLTAQVEKLKGKLLLIHGLQDPVVVQQHSVNFVKACVDKGVQVDYMIYPGHEHNVTGKDRAHLYQKVTDYFMQNLADIK